MLFAVSCFRVSTAWWTILIESVCALWRGLLVGDECRCALSMFLKGSCVGSLVHTVGLVEPLRDDKLVRPSPSEGINTVPRRISYFPQEQIVTGEWAWLLSGSCFLSYHVTFLCHTCSTAVCWHPCCDLAESSQQKLNSWCFPVLDFKTLKLLTKINPFSL